MQNKSVILNVVLALAVVVLAVRLVSGVANEKNPQPKISDNNFGTTFASAPSDIKEEQETSDGSNNGFKPYDITNELDTNPFSYFTGHGLLLCAGDKNSSNAMTIGWGALGTLWGKPTATVYVRSDRYTHKFMEKSKYFTIMKFADNKIVDYMGTHSGRDGNKADALGLHVAYTKNGAPYYKEASVVIECRTMYAQPFNRDGFRDNTPKEFYADPKTKGFVHTEYIGEVINAMKK